MNRHLLALLLFLIVLLTGGVPARAFCADTAGRVERHTYRSTLMAVDMPYSLYLPPCYDVGDARYPVLYLMHGSNSDDTHWLRLGLADALDRGILQNRLPPMVVVLPFGDWLANENQFGDVSWSNVFLSELLPAVETAFRINPTQRAVGGISRGGFWAFNVALRYPHLFDAVGGHSAFFDEFHAPPDQNPLTLAANAAGIEALRIWLDRGRDDYAQLNLDRMADTLAARGVAHTYTVYPVGEHADWYWSAHLNDYLAFYAANWHAPIVLPLAQSPRYLLLPAVAFPSLQASIPGDALRRVAAGEADASLIVSETAAAALRDHSVTLNPAVRVVPDAGLLDALWRERTAYTLLPFDHLTTRYRVLMVDELHPLDGDLSRYPFAFAGAAPNYDPAKLTRVLLSGVTALARNTLAALDARGVAWAGSGILPYVSRADVFHISSEVSFAPRCPSSDDVTLGGFCARDAHFALLTYLGVDVVELTGNHNADYGYGAYRRTLRIYHDAGMVTIGGGETLDDARAPYVFDYNGSTVALLACNWNGPYYALVNQDPALAGGVRPGAAYCEMGWLREALPALKTRVDVLIVTVQYAEYEQYTPIERQVNDFRALADLGADAVIGTQAHKPQTFEFYTAPDGRPVFLHYGLGNLFFDQPFWGNVRFFMDQVMIYDGRLLTVDLFTGIIDDNARPRPMTPDERLNWLQFMFIQQNGF